MGACTTMSCCFAKPAAIRERLSPVIRYSLSVRLQRLHPVDRVTAAVGLVGGGAICCMNRTSSAILGSTAVLCKIVRPLRSDRGQQAAREVVAADSERGGVDPVRLKRAQTRLGLLDGPADPVGCRRGSPAGERVVEAYRASVGCAGADGLVGAC